MDTLTTEKADRSKLLKDAESRVAEIAECIYKEMKTNPCSAFGGLCGGKFGSLLFLFYYGDFTKKKKFTLIAEQSLMKLLTQLERNLLGFSYANGYTGILYLFHFLQEREFVVLDFSGSEEIIENYMINQARICMKINDFDYLHGSLGIAFYFLRKKPNHPFLNEFIDFLYKAAEKNSLNHSVKWKTPNGKGRELGYYISLSHGMSSIVLFLCRILKSASWSKSINCLAMLEGCMNYILLQKIDYTQYGSYFSIASLENNQNPTQSRVAWCYGDLGIAWALLQSGIAVNNRQWQDKAIEIMTFATRRVNREQTMVNDCGLCHGSAGIAMMFRRFFLETNENLFFDAWIFWIEYTLNFKRFDDGLAGFKACELTEWKNDYSLLTGISGIGLSLLSFIRDDSQEWDELFLLS